MRDFIGLFLCKIHPVENMVYRLLSYNLCHNRWVVLPVFKYGYHRQHAKRKIHQNSNILRGDQKCDCKILSWIKEYGE
jgi:hypothetical protein